MTPAQVEHTMSPDLFPLLCQAWGESDRPCAFIAYTEAEVRKFIVNQWWGDETDERVDEVMSDLRGHDWKDEPEWHAEFEIGGVSFKPIYESNSRAAVEAALRDAPQAEGWVMVPAEPTNAMVGRFFDAIEGGPDWDDTPDDDEDKVEAFAEFSKGYRAMLAATPGTPTAERHCQYNSGSCKRRSCVVECQAMKLISGSAPTAVKPDEPLKWCSYCGEGVTAFCRGKQSPDWDYKCPVLNLPARASKGTK